MSTSVRILVLGAANGRLTEIFAKLSSLNAKAGPFDIVLCLGDLFGEAEDEYLQQLIAGEVEIPVSTYFTVGRRELPQPVRMLVGHGGQVCENLFFLGRRGTFSTAEGLKLMYLGGVEGDPTTEFSPTFNRRDIDQLSGSADVLMTTLAPAGIGNLSAKPFDKGSPLIAQLVQKINPRYHFASEGVFYEREPYDNGNGYTRFLSLGDVKEDRWYYAFKININPEAAEKPPAGLTSNPFKKREREFNMDNRTCRICGDPSHLSYDCPDRPRKRKRKVINPNDCFFCLSNVNIQKQMIVSIGTEVYVALAKGPLTTSESSGLPLPGHLIIINIAHTPTTTESETAEFSDYSSRLTKFFSEKGCDTVMWEIRHSEGIHAHRQVVAVPKGKDLEDDFVKGFAERNMSLEKREPGESEEYCCVTLPSGSYIATLPQRFDLQLPRRILAKVLGLEERAEWRSCIQAPEKEAADGMTFRNAFEKAEVLPSE